MGGSLGRTLIIAGVTIAVLGALILTGGSWLPLGRLPGDIHIQRGNFSFYFPVTTSILLSLVITLLLRFLGRR